MGFCRSISVTAAVGLAGCLTAPPDDIGSPPGAGAGGADAAPGDDGEPAGTLYIVPSGPSITTAPLGGTGGGPYAETCADGRFLTGLGGQNNGAGMTGVWARCSRFQIGADSAVEVIDTVDGAHVLGDPDSETLEPVECSPGLVAVGFIGSLNFNDLVGHLQLQCGPVAWDGVSATVGAASEETAVLGVVDDTAIAGGPCDAGRAAGGIAGRVGLLVDQFRLECFGLETESTL